MAGDWIPWSKGLSRKLEVLRISHETARPRREVACLLMEFWEWADGETEDGTLPGMDVRILSALHADTDERFWSAVIGAGWLQGTDTGMLIPHFLYWMGESAKRRLKDTKRKRQSRTSEGAGVVRNLSACDADKNGTTGQDRTVIGEVSPNPSCSEPLFAATEPTTATTSAPVDEAQQRQEPRGQQSSAQPEARRRKRAVGGGLPSELPQDAVLVFPCSGKGSTADIPLQWALREGKLREYREAFLGLDVLAESRKALQWCRDNPAKRKTPRGMPAFLWRWFERAQNSGHGRTNGTTEPSGSMGPSSRVRAGEAKKSLYGNKTIRASNLETPNGTQAADPPKGSPNSGGNS